MVVSVKNRIETPRIVGGNNLRDMRLGICDRDLRAGNYSSARIFCGPHDSSGHTGQGGVVQTEDQDQRDNRFRQLPTP